MNKWYKTTSMYSIKQTKRKLKMRKMNIQKLFVVTIIFISATLFTGCTGMKFTSAVSKGDTTTAQSLLEQGEADVNKELSFGKTPIFYALDNNHDDMVRLLL